MLKNVASDYTCFHIREELSLALITVGFTLVNRYFYVWNLTP